MPTQDVHQCLQGWSVRDTQSNFSAVWDLLQVGFSFATNSHHKNHNHNTHIRRAQVVLLLYVCVSVPFGTGFDLTVETGSFIWSAPPVQPAVQNA